MIHNQTQVSLFKEDFFNMQGELELEKVKAYFNARPEISSLIELAENFPDYAEEFLNIILGDTELANIIFPNLTEIVRLETVPAYKEVVVSIALHLFDKIFLNLEGKLNADVVKDFLKANPDVDTVLGMAYQSPKNAIKLIEMILNDSELAQVIIADLSTLKFLVEKAPLCKEIVFQALFGDSNLLEYIIKDAQGFCLFAEYFSDCMEVLFEYLAKNEKFQIQVIKSNSDLIIISKNHPDRKETLFEIIVNNLVLFRRLTDNLSSLETVCSLSPERRAETISLFGIVGQTVKSFFGEAVESPFRSTMLAMFNAHLKKVRLYTTKDKTALTDLRELIQKKISQTQDEEVLTHLNATLSIISNLLISSLKNLSMVFFNDKKEAPAFLPEELSSIIEQEPQPFSSPSTFLRF